jgi:hypothetical protein
VFKYGQHVALLKVGSVDGVHEKVTDGGVDVVARTCDHIVTVLVQVAEVVLRDHTKGFVLPERGRDGLPLKLNDGTLECFNLRLLPNTDVQKLVDGVFRLFPCQSENAKGQSGGLVAEF